MKQQKQIPAILLASVLLGSGALHAEPSTYVRGKALYESADPEQLKKALVLFKKGAEAGHTESQYMLGKMALEGLGLPKPYPTTAIKWLTQAAENGHAAAAFELGRFLLDRTDGKQDLKGAKEFLDQAARSGMKEAQESLGRVKIALEQKNVDEKQRLAKESFLKNPEWTGFLVDLQKPTGLANSIWDSDCSVEMLEKNFSSGAKVSKGSNAFAKFWDVTMGLAAGQDFGIAYKMMPVLSPDIDTTLPPTAAFYEAADTAVICIDNKPVAWLLDYQGDEKALEPKLSKYGEVKSIWSYDGEVYESRPGNEESKLVTRTTDLGVIKIFYLRPAFVEVYAQRVKAAKSNEKTKEQSATDRVR